jgi:enterochelin esterase family protein
LKYRAIIMVAALSLSGLIAYSQQALWGGEEIISPEINENKAVTFRLSAPDATEVKITGDWMPVEGWVPGTVVMKRDEKGTWIHSTDSLEPEIYSYTFLVDGLRVNDPNNAFLSRDISTNTNIFLIEGGQADLYKVNDVPHGSVTRRWYNSPGLEMNRRITIYTPPGYESTQEIYPVLYLLHGAGGDEEAWMELGRASQIMDNLIAQGKARAMILVMPNGNVSQEAAPGESTRGYYKPQFMIPGTMNGKYEESFMDIVNFVEANYRVRADKASRAVAGLSMGGFHALHISRYYPNAFDYVGLFSAAIMPPQDASSKVYDDIDGTLKTQMENGYKLYWIAIGKTDFLHKNVAEYRKKLDAMGMSYTYRESEEGHIWKNWRIYLSEFVPQLFN